MRIVFVDPHIHTCGKNLFHFFRKNKSYSKYGYLIEYALRNKIDIAFYIEHNLGLSKFFFYIFIYIWCIGNKYNFLKISILFHSSKLKKDDILFSFIFKILESRIILDFAGKKIIHTTHYGLNTAEISILLQNIKNYSLIGENNLIENSAYFKKLFPLYQKEFYILPFTYQKRFKSRKDFASRKNKAIALGTLQTSLQTTYGKRAKDILDFLGTDTSWHPMRKTIYENKIYLKKEIDCYIYDVQDYSLYLSFDMVKLFNQYKMFIVPEEVFDLPGIGMIEGMATGSVYIGKKSAMYDVLGLIDGVHYIGYDGTLENLSYKIQFLQNNPVLLEKISQNGMNFTHKNFKPNTVAKDFYTFLGENI